MDLGNPISSQNIKDSGTARTTTARVKSRAEVAEEVKRSTRRRSHDNAVGTSHFLTTLTTLPFLRPPPLHMQKHPTRRERTPRRRATAAGAASTSAASSVEQAASETEPDDGEAETEEAAAAATPAVATPAAAAAAPPGTRTAAGSGAPAAAPARATTGWSKKRGAAISLPERASHVCDLRPTWASFPPPCTYMPSAAETRGTRLYDLILVQCFILTSHSQAARCVSHARSNFFVVGLFYCIVAPRAVEGERRGTGGPAPGHHHPQRRRGQLGRGRASHQSAPGRGGAGMRWDGHALGGCLRAAVGLSSPATS